MSLQKKKKHLMMVINYDDYETVNFNSRNLAIAFLSIKTNKDITNKQKAARTATKRNVLPKQDTKTYDNNSKTTK